MPVNRSVPDVTEKRKNWNDCRTFQTLFEHYLKDILLPHLNGNSVLVMDNMKSHHAKAVKICWTALEFDIPTFLLIVLT